MEIRRGAARLFRVERKTEGLRSYLKRFQETFRPMLMWESKDEVVGTADDGHITLCMTIPPLPCPQIQDEYELRIGERTSAISAFCLFPR